MNETTHSLRFGETNIEYTLIYSPRKTLAIHVHSDQRVTVKAPLQYDSGVIEAFLRKRAPWILRKQREFARRPPKPPPQRYASGENISYLGRHYCLQVIEGERDWVKLTHSHLEVTTPSKANTDHVRVQVETWVYNQARHIFYERILAILPRFTPLTLGEPGLVVKPLKARWGSCAHDGKITLNLELMKMPLSCIDYVVAHELCHLVEHNHSKRFYALLDRVMPDWRERRVRLNEGESVSG